MPDQHEIITALEARISELERNQTNLQQITRMTKSRLSRRRAAAFGLVVALIAVPGVVLAGHRFSDVPNGHPFHDDIDWVADYGIANGFADGTYRPGSPVTRQAMAAFLHRLSNEFELVTNATNPSPSTIIYGYALCPDDKRPIAGGAYMSATNTFIVRSYPAGNGWYVDWETDDNATVDPTHVVVYALCAPRV